MRAVIWFALACMWHQRQQQGWDVKDVNLLWDA
jgi:hypothetical protein